MGATLTTRCSVTDCYSTPCSAPAGVHDGWAPGGRCIPPPISSNDQHHRTLLNQMGGAWKISAMTGAQIVTDQAAATLVFKKQAGAKKITHLKVSYNAGTDLYDLQGFKYNRKTLACPQVLSMEGIYAEDLKRTCEEITGLYFTL